MTLSRRAAYFLVGYALLMLLVGTGMPTPLYHVYGQKWGFSSGLVTVIFAVYVLLLIPSLLFFGKVSDQLGRKRVLLPGLLLAVLGSILFALAQGVVWLFIARAIQGIATGAVSGSATAALVEQQPDGDRRRASVFATTANNTGAAIGPLLAGLLAQYAPLPLMLPYLVQIALLLPSALLVGALPEKNRASLRDVSWKPRRPGVPRSIRRPFGYASASAFIAWAVAGLFLTVVPTYTASVLHTHNLAVEGGIVFLMFGASALVQLLLRSLSPRPAMASGLVLLAAGLVGIVMAYPATSTWLLLVGAALTGLGQGLAFMGSLALVTAVTPEERRADVNSSLYVVIYVGVGLPVLGVGFGAGIDGLFPAVLVFAVVFGVLSLAAALLMARQGDLSTRPATTEA